jgi:hypothetical protein
MAKDTSGFTYTQRANGDIVRSDGVVISQHATDSDNALYRAWLAAGNTPAAEALPAPKQPAPNRFTKKNARR